MESALRPPSAEVRAEMARIDAEIARQAAWSESQPAAEPAAAAEPEAEPAFVAEPAPPPEPEPLHWSIVTGWVDDIVPVAVQVS